ncbi:hypothetical protein [Halorubrum sp. PV6]|uniref:hypothetical protein n=1 Tax=Halorubrum sp. PV6 TaxID=634157 RepID=UPI000F8F1F5B|nr:hypothetical protein [Halorubrum sp. PV6]
MSTETDTEAKEQEEEEETFEYGGGELVFNSIIRTDVKRDDPEGLRDQILDQLPDFEQGDPGQQGSGSIELNLEEFAEEENVQFDLREVADDILGIEYRYEEYPNEPIEAVEYRDGEPRYVDAFPRKTRSVFLYWDYPKTIFVQGAQTRVDDVAPTVNSSLKNKVSFTYHDFDEEFLLWLVLKDKHSEDLSTGLEIVELNSTEITGGDPADFGRDAEVDDSDDISQSLPILAGILKDMDVAMLEGDFAIGKHRVNAKIFGDGRVRLYANRDLGPSTKLERALISIKFLTEIMEEYRSWEDLPTEEKYPHPRYFEDLHNEANDMGANFDFDFTPLVHRYADLRGEDPNSYNLDFEIYEPDE